MTVRAAVKYFVSSSRTVSGSRDSDSGVKPTTSQNSTEHTRRSASGPAPGSVGGTVTDTVPVIADGGSANAKPHA